MPMSSLICLASVPLLVPAGPPLHLQKDNLYLGNPYLGNRGKSPSLSWSPCTSHRATLGGDRLKVSKKDGPRLLPQPLPIKVITGNDVKDDYCKYKVSIIEDFAVKKTRTSSPLPQPEPSSSKLSSGVSGLHQRSMALMTMFLVIRMIMRKLRKIL